MSQADLERFFYLDDVDRALVAGLRGDHNRLGFSVQLATARFVGRFLADPLEGVPTEVIDYLAGQLRISDPSCVKRYAQREPTHREHAGKIQKALKLQDVTQVEAELSVYVGKRAWVTGDAPKAIHPPHQTLVTVARCSPSTRGWSRRAGAVIRKGWSWCRPGRAVSAALSIEAAYYASAFDEASPAITPGEVLPNGSS